MLENALYVQVFVPFRNFIKREEFAGILLLIFTLIALVWANSPWYDLYINLQQMDVAFQIGTVIVSQTVIHWINDGLMAIFFFVIGLEIKREILAGALSSFKQASLPIAAAIGGMIVPALIYTIFNFGKAGSPGWGIPMATDIAFALGVLSLLGNRVPFSLKVFLTAVAVVDDIGAVVVIAFCYTSEIVWISLFAGTIFFLLLITLNRMGVKNIAFYGIFGICLWFCLLTSGIHATIAGILAAFTIPVKNKFSTRYFMLENKKFMHELAQLDISSDDLLNNRRQHSIMSEIEAICRKVESPLISTEQRLHPWVTYFIMPLFALANAGVNLNGDPGTIVTHPVSIGIMAGLLLGKPVGIVLGAWLMIKLNISSLPHSVSWRQLYGVSWLGGIGFTMSLLIANLAFTDVSNLYFAKIGILSASILAAITGWVILRKTCTRIKGVRS
ncbi:MAG: Na+/H+ antiporter NhaA [Desulfobacteraceae bacterium]|nr:Na+/H+ antiporter NhaA [Desulfobacteraceae bacterium]